MKRTWRLKDGRLVTADTRDLRLLLPAARHPGQRFATSSSKWEVFHKLPTGNALEWAPVAEWSDYDPTSGERHLLAPVPPLPDCLKPLSAEDAAAVPLPSREDVERALQQPAEIRYPRPLPLGRFR